MQEERGTWAELALRSVFGSRAVGENVHFVMCDGDSNGQTRDNARNAVEGRALRGRRKHF